MKSLAEQTFRQIAERSGIAFAVRFADAREWRSSEASPEFTLVFRNPRAYWRMAAFGHVGMLEAYFAGEVDVEGSLPRALAAGMAGRADNPTLLVRMANRWHEFVHSNSNWLRAKHNAEFHYALGPEFYRLWLDDPLMLYTCAYWSEGARTLEEAQRSKLDHVARKVLLKPGEDVVDIGSGFGGFLLYAEERFGVKVTGINTTGSQVEHARREIEKRRLGHTLSLAGDFRSLGRQFDKVVSIGCLEHAGRDGLVDLIRAHASCLKPGGLGLIHFIGHVGHFETDYFIRKYVFPGGWIPSLADVVVEMEKAGLEVIDVENLRRHYALTLDAWGERFDKNWERIKAIDPQRFDERFRRIWRVYLYGCAEMFRSPVGRTHLFQVVFSKGNVSTTSYPMTRSFLYEQEREQRRSEQPARPEKRSPGRAA
ncbi:MAG TPA: cyclopropane-fatty-acyl-phospholipid synthase family protein [Burkholderiales bacterium]|nr:cyclopropane-fatty-acyl-phospholipid synthase family protein [Burkholderiales bacterium]